MNPTVSFLLLAILVVASVESQRCGFMRRTCDEDEYCKTMMIFEMCVKKGSEGMRCSDSEPCKEGLVCQEGGRGRSRCVEAGTTISTATTPDTMTSFTDASTTVNTEASEQ